LGIGLTLVKRLVEMHGGAIEARSDGDGKGSEFIVELPVDRLDARSTPAVVGGDETSIGSPRHRILVVDDNQDAADTLATLLKMLGHDTQKTHDGLQALKAAEDDRPEIILLDIGMPGMSGYDVCRRIRQQPGGREIVIIAVTGWGQEEDRRNSHAAGFDYHLVKPVELSALRAVFAEFEHLEHRPG
jgi:CheY-like chemotaxis protein